MAHFVAVGGVVGDDCRVGGGEDGGVAVGVLESFAGEGGPSCGGADDEAAGHLVRGGPEGVAGALEAEHGVEHVDRDQRYAVGGVGGAGGGEGCDGAGFVDAGVDQLALGGFLVGQDQVPVHGEVVLALGVVDLGRGEERVHAERACLIGDDRRDVLAELLVPHEVLEQADEGHGGGCLLLARTALGHLIGLRVRKRDGGMLAAALRNGAAQRCPALHHVRDFRRIVAGVEVRRLVGIALELLIRDRDAQVVPERLEVVEGEFLHLVCGVAAFEVRAEAVALDRFGQDDGGFALEFGGCLVRGVDLAVVVAAALEVPDLVIAQVRDHVLGLRGLPEEVLADEPAGFGLVGLVVPVRGLVHDLHQGPVVVLGQEVIPFPAPDDLDDVPARAAEERFEFLHDLPVAAHRPVQALQVAVDHEVQVVQVLVRGELEQAAGLGLVHFPVAQERPDLLVGGVFQAAVVQVPVGLGLVDRVHRPDAHGHGGEFPEPGHQPRVRVGGQGVPGLGLFLPEPVQVFLGQPAFHEGTGVHAGGSVALEEDLVPAAGVVLAAEEVVEPDLVQGRGTGVGGDVPANADVRALGPVHHDRGVPAHVRPVAALVFLVARERCFLVRGNRVHIVRGGDHRNPDALGAGTLQETAHDVLGTLGALFPDQRIQGLNPFGGLFRITIRQLVSQPAEDMGGIFSCSHGSLFSSLNVWALSFRIVRKHSCHSRLCRSGRAVKAGRARGAPGWPEGCLRTDCDSAASLTAA
ncbi:hypothetical protein D9M72_362650 [compost metagenome]